MTGLFVALGIAILTLIAILLWFVPHILQQHSQQVAYESAQLREMISEVINEHEAVAMRQVQLGTSISYLQEQLEHMFSLSTTDQNNGPYMLTTIDPQAIQVLEDQVNVLQTQIDRYIRAAQVRTRQENESWVYLLGLLGAIQERISVLSAEQQNMAATSYTGSGQRLDLNGRRDTNTSGPYFS
jgi:Na+/phosphate symporter